jgi:hypothetical protein
MRMNRQPSLVIISVARLPSAQRTADCERLLTVVAAPTHPADDTLCRAPGGRLTTVFADLPVKRMARQNADSERLGLFGLRVVAGFRSPCSVPRVELGVRTCHHVGRRVRRRCRARYAESVLGELAAALRRC